MLRIQVVCWKDDESVFAVLQYLSDLTGCVFSRPVCVLGRIGVDIEKHLVAKV